MSLLNLYEKKELQEIQQYWLNELSDANAELQIPTDLYKTGEVFSNKLVYIKKIDNNMIKNIQNYCLNKNLNLEILLFSIYYSLVYRLSNEVEIMIGKNFNQNLLPVKISLEHTRDIYKIYDLVNSKVQEIKEYNISQQELISLLNDKKIFDTIFSVNESIQNKNTLIDWECHINEEKFEIWVHYSESKFNNGTILKYVEYFEKLLHNIIEEKETNISKIDILTIQDYQLYKQLNNTHKDFDQNQTIHNMFVEVAKKYPNHIAVSSEDGSITYNDLDKKSNQLARSLFQKGLKIGDFVNIYMERSIETIISILGILKAGGVYVPVDPEHPDDRNIYIIADTKSPFILTKKEYINKVQKLIDNNTHIKDVIVINDSLNDYSDDIVSLEITNDQLAYVIYTSGSTGKPKGTLIPHKGIINLGYGIQNVMNFNDTDIVTQFSTYSFDASVWDTIGALFRGARLHLLSKEERISVEAFATVIEKIKATSVAIIPTVFFNQLSSNLSDEGCKKLSSIKSIAIAGEALTGEVIRTFQRKFKNHIKIMNLYGPTETTVVTTTYTIDEIVDEKIVNIPIGKPLYNYKTYILNEEKQLCPINVAGELYIETIGLAKGYLNQIEKTNESFINNPFSQKEKIYKTGDIVRLLNNGNIEFVGRKDNQVKIRGYRVEIGEIENAFSKYDNVRDVAIIPIKDVDNNVTLIAFYTMNTHEEANFSSIKKFLAEKLPSYMIPKFIVYLDKMPLSPTGKIDRKKLATYEIQEQKHEIEIVKPQNKIQQQILNAWKEVLGTDQISIYDDFFEIGGHSLKVINILVYLKPIYPKLKINDFFNYKSIYDLAYYIETQDMSLEIQEELDIDTIIDLEEYPRKLQDRSYLQYESKNVLLTGATGYLGSHILYELLKTTSANIYCLVRKTTTGSLKRRLIKNLENYFKDNLLEEKLNRIHVIEGDLEKQSIGLSSENRQFILNNIDTIIHSAADVRHFGDSSLFLKTNVKGTEFLLSLLKENNKIRFHHISTIGIPEDLALEGKWDNVVNSYSFDNNLQLENVYTNSKLEAEKLVYQAEKEGLKVTVYRPGNLTCRSTDGLFQTNIESNSFYRMIKAMLLLGKAPKANCYVDFTPIDFASQAIVNLVFQEDSVGQTFHICNPNQIHYSKMIEFINKLGYEIELLDLKEYKEWLFNNDSKDLEGIQLAIAQLEGDGAKNSKYRFACPVTKSILLHTDIKCAEVNIQFIDKMFKHAIQRGYFPR